MRRLQVMSCISATVAALAVTASSPCRAQSQADSATALLSQGDGQRKARQFNAALASYHAALALFHSLGDARGEGTTLNNIGLAYAGSGQLDSALTYYRASLALKRATGQRAAQANTLSNVGDTFRLTGQGDSALTYYRQALVLDRESGNRAYEASSLNNIGAVYLGTGYSDSALTYLVAALPLYRSVGDRIGEATALGNIGVTFSRSDHPDSALSYYQRALAIHRAVGDRSEGPTLANIGSIYKDKGYPDSALTYYGAALLVQRAIGDRSGQAKTLGSIGEVHHDIGRPDSALAYYRAALSLSRAVGDRASEATHLHDIGATFANLGQPDSALVYSRAALPLRRATSQRPGEALTLQLIGVIYGDAGQSDSALVYLRAALGLQRVTRSRAAEATTLNNIGSVLRRSGQIDSAFAAYRAALLIQRAAGDRNREATTLNNIGTLHDDVGRRDSALAYYRAALRLRRAVDDQLGEAVTLNNVAVLYYDTGHPDSAIAVLDSAVVLYAKIRMHAGSDVSAVAFSEDQPRRTADLWVRSWLASGTGTKEVTSALAAAERGRAQGLRDLLARSRASAGPNANDALWASDTIPGANLASEAQLALAPLRDARTAVLYYFFAGDTITTWLLSPSGELRLTDHAAVRSDSLAALVTMLRTGLGADAARTRMARGGAVEQERVSVPAGTNAGARGVDDEASAASTARVRAATVALGALLLPAELWRRVPLGSDLVVVPHGVLGLVPFAALTAPDDTVPLGARYALRYAPSLRALGAAEVRGAGWERAATRGARSARSALVVGDPAMPSVTGVDGRRIPLKDLPAARSEGAAVAKRFGVTLLSDSSASETTVRQALPAARLVHLATHGLAYGTEARVRDSYVALAPDAKNDGLLTIGELLDDVPSLAADLVVLSACQTGLGDLKQAEGTVGFQRALLAKGARSVLVSLWSVDDRATALLMQRFYTHWLGPDGRPARSKAEALRLAQSDVRLTPGFESPRFWAAFQLVGAR